MENKLNLKKEEMDYKYAYASFGLRALAYIIDMLVISGLVNIIKNLIGLDFSLYDFDGLAIIHLLVLLSYFTITSLLTRGQSLGKLITGLRVVSLSGEKLTNSQILIREIAGRYVQNKFQIIYLLALFTPKRQTLIDLFVDTAVVKEAALIDLYIKASDEKDAKDEEI